MQEKLIIALDVPTFAAARELVDRLGSAAKIYKVGSQLFTACGPAVVRHLLAAGKDVFLDLKFHDIPNTVASAVTAVAGLSQKVFKAEKEPAAWGRLLLCTLHIAGGKDMMRFAVEAAAKEARRISVPRPYLVGITALTSDAKTENLSAVVLEKASLAKAAGLDGAVASVQEAALLRKEFGKDFIIVTPGIRPSGAAIGDQKRVATPAEAVKNGSDYLVVGRPIVEAEDPVAALCAILREMDAA
ncbi:MAG: orotidine-5'-phosphate decarboxylase [Candidatus Omnitrophica bacterium]|nr:orotidine-5'-phosphate decarboxylase [Candidatus Omnitrophota bacterium]